MPSDQTPTARIDRRIPATVVTGFLGSGKTTLINRILTEQHGRKLAVIVNEFGEISIDGQLVIHDDQAQLVEFNNGCLCCTVRGDLIETLEKLQERAGTLDAILIETTGLADPAPVASTFFVSDEVKARIRLDAFVTVVDAVNLETNLEQSNEAVEQVAFSDIVLINKIDLATPEQVQAIEARIRKLNPLATIHHTSNAEIDIAKVLNVGAFDLVQKLDVDPEFLGDHLHEHDAAVGSFVLQEENPIDINRFVLWMNAMAQERGDDLYRTKGIFYAQSFRERVVFQSVRMLTTMRPDRLWAEGEKRMSQFVVIGKNLDRDVFAAGFANCIVRPPGSPNPLQPDKGSMMPIEAGQPLPEMMLKHMTPEGIKDISTTELLSGKKVILFGLPGAYTPVCSISHLPGFVAEADKLKSEGIDTIACVSVNDPFVMQAWGDVHGTSGKVLMLSDPEAALTTAIGLDLDLSGIGLGTRSQRYSMVVDDGVVASVNVEGSIFDHEASSASRLRAPAAS